MTKTALPLLLALPLLAAPAEAADRRAAQGEARLAKMLAGRVAGKAVACINLHDVRSSQVVDGTAIVYEGPGGTLYVNRPSSGAETLRGDDILVSRTPTDQLCRPDVIRLIDRTSQFERGFVGLSDFVPYPRAERPRR